MESTARTSQACGIRFMLARAQVSPDPKGSPDETECPKPAADVGV